MTEKTLEEIKREIADEIPDFPLKDAQDDAETERKRIASIFPYNDINADVTEEIIPLNEGKKNLREREILKIKRVYAWLILVSGIFFILSLLL